MAAADLDPWTVHVTRADGQQLGMSVRSSYGGFFAMVSAVQPDSPADKSGITSGVYIHKINGLSMEGRTHDEFVQALAAKDLDIVFSKRGLRVPSVASPEGTRTFTPLFVEKELSKAMLVVTRWPMVAQFGDGVLVLNGRDIHFNPTSPLNDRWLNGRMTPADFSACIRKINASSWLAAIGKPLPDPLIWERIRKGDCCCDCSFEPFWQGSTVYRDAGRQQEKYRSDMIKVVGRGAFQAIKELNQDWVPRGVKFTVQEGEVLADEVSMWNRLLIHQSWSHRLYIAFSDPPAAQSPPADALPPGYTEAVCPVPGDVHDRQPAPQKEQEQLPPSAHHDGGDLV